MGVFSNQGSSLSRALGSYPIPQAQRTIGISILHQIIHFFAAALTRI